MKNRHHRSAVAIILLLLSAALILGPELFFNRIAEQSDVVLHYTWSAEFSKSLREGTLYPRWLPDEKFGLGDPTFVYYPPVYSLLVSLLSWAGLGIWTSMKLVELCAAWFTGVFAWLFLRRWIGIGWALAGAITVESCPFLIALLCDFNARPWYTATPLVMATLFYASGEKRGSLPDPRLAVSFALVVVTHVLTGLMVLICLPFVAVGNPWDNALQCVRRMGWSLAIGLGLAGIYLVPALLDMSAISPHNWFRGVLDWHGAFAFPIVTGRFFPVRWFAFQWVVPAAALAITAALGVGAWPLRKLRRKRAALIRGLLGVSLVALFFSSELSYPVWSRFSSLQMIQFPYRFNYIQMIAGTLGCFLCLGCAGSRTGRFVCAIPMVVSLLLTPAIMVHNLDRHMPEFVDRKVARGHEGAPEYLPAKAGPGWHVYVDRGGFLSECASKGVACRETLHKSNRRSWQVQSTAPGSLLLPVFYYPAWRLRVDGAATPVHFDAGTGLISVTLPPGRHDIAVEWGTLPYAELGELCSFVALLALAGIEILNAAAAAKLDPAPEIDAVES